MHEPVENITSALDSVQKPGSEIHGGAASRSVLRERKFVEGGGGFLVHDEVCLF